MKDWKTYAIVALALWCAYLTFTNCKTRHVSGSSTDITDSPPVFDRKGESITWNAESGNGLTLDCYCRIAPVVSNSSYSSFQRCRLNIGANGNVENAELLPERIRLTARSGVNK